MMTGFDINVVIGSAFGVVLGAILTYFISEYKSFKDDEIKKFDIFSDTYYSIAKMMKTDEIDFFHANFETMIGTLQTKKDTLALGEKDSIFLEDISLLESHYKDVWKKKYDKEFSGAARPKLGNEEKKLSFNEYRQEFKQLCIPIIRKLELKNSTKHVPYGYKSNLKYFFKGKSKQKRSIISKSFLCRFWEKPHDMQNSPRIGLALGFLILAVALMLNCVQRVIDDWDIFVVTLGELVIIVYLMFLTIWIGNPFGWCEKKHPSGAI